MKKYWLHNMQSKVIRLQIKLFKLVLGEDTLIPILPIRSYQWKELIKIGPSFAYKGDEVVWDWRGKKWASVDCGGLFPSLKDVDAFWARYDEQCGYE